MPRSQDFMQYITEDVLRPALMDIAGHDSAESHTGITSRGMFSGYGIYLDGVIVGIIAEGEFYLKADRALAEKYKQEGLYPFTYTGHQGRAHELLYMSVPEETMEDREAIRARVLESYAISKKAKK